MADGCEGCKIKDDRIDELRARADRAEAEVRRLAEEGGLAAKLLDSAHLLLWALAMLAPGSQLRIGNKMLDVRIREERIIKVGTDVDADETIIEPIPHTVYLKG